MRLLRVVRCKLCATAEDDRQEVVVVSYTGGCLCGALRYPSNDKPIDIGYCHCRICQRSAGSPVLT